MFGVMPPKPKTTALIHLQLGAANRNIPVNKLKAAVFYTCLFRWYLQDLSKESIW